MVDHARGARDGKVGPTLGRVAASLPDVPSGVRVQVAKANSIFEHLPGMAQALVNRCRPKSASLHRGPKRFAVGMGQGCQGAFAELLDKARRRLSPSQQGRRLAAHRLLAGQPACEQLAAAQPSLRFD